MMAKPRLRMRNGQWTVLMKPQPPKHPVFAQDHKRKRLLKAAFKWAYNRNVLNYRPASIPAKDE